MWKLLVLLVVSVPHVFGQTWLSRARVVDHTSYFAQVMQETVYEVERRGFSNLKLRDISDTINLQMYTLLIAGEVKYTNGFVLSIQKIEVTNMVQMVQSSTTAGQVATVTGQLHLRNIKVGYDVEAELEVLGRQRFTGDYLHTVATFQFQISKNLGTNVTSVGSSLLTLSAGSPRMTYRPANNITEVLSRSFFSYLNLDGISAWRNDIFVPIVLDIVTNKIPYPRICFSNC